MLNTKTSLNIDQIEQTRQTAVIGRKVVLYKSTASTNDVAWEYAVNPANHGLCVLAEEQTKGRGRRGRKWLGGAGESILCSILLIETAIEAELLTLTAAVATAEAIRSFCGLNAGVKWPNDILVGGKKLAGILVEKRTVGGRMCCIVGIGINCNQEAGAFEGHAMKMPPTSIKMETDLLIDRTGLVCALLSSFEAWLIKAIEVAQDKNNRPSSIAHRPSNPVINRWLQLSALLGRRVTVEHNNKTFSGFCRGIDPAEGLIVQLESGPVRAFDASHTSLVQVE